MNGFDSAISLVGGSIRILAEGPGYGVSTLFLALIFAWSGVVKLRRPALAAMAMVDFGVTRRVRPRLGFALGTVELILALALVLGGPTSRLTLAGTATLLWIFVLLIARSLWSGERFACFCFGEAGSELSNQTLIRTASLALLASALALAAAPIDAYRGLDGTSVLEASVATAVLGSAVLLGRVPDLFKWNRDVLEPNTQRMEGDR